ncbi:hypothetical protein FRC10_002101 [Ceratobasidium sp. 414]|nr:hypothetical protein FRC10_002101 [Ceratobasidium sp. 414]
MATETEHITIPLQTLVLPGSRQNPQSGSTSPIRPNPRLVPENSRGGSNDGHHITAEELAATSLPPVDRGFKAWSFIAAAFVIETLVWGFGFTNKTFGDASEAAIGAVGTTTLAIGYFEYSTIDVVKPRVLLWEFDTGEFRNQERSSPSGSIPSEDLLVQLFSEDPE